MLQNIIYRLDPLSFCLVLLGLFIAAVEIGFWMGKRRMKGGSESLEKGDIALIVGAVMTLLSLLLGFTYSMSASRFEERRQLVVKEADAIGTTYLRAKTLQEPQSSEIQELLRQYIALRAEIANTTDTSPENIRAIDNRTKQLHDLIWAPAIVLAMEHPNAIVSLFLQTLNEMIDLHTQRMAAYRNRVPFSIYLVLVVLSVISLWLGGYYFGPHRKRAWILLTMLAILVALVMWLILDFDHPSHGTIKASQQSLIDLHQDLNQESREAAK